MRLKNEVNFHCKGNSDPNIAAANFENILEDIAKQCLTKKTHIVKNNTKTKNNKWMNDSCFTAKKDFIKSKKEFLKFPRDMGRRLMFLNTRKKCKNNFLLYTEGL